MNLRPLALAILLPAFFAASAISAAQKKPDSAIENKPFQPAPVCGHLGKNRISVPSEYLLAGVIFNEESNGLGCEREIIAAGLYLNPADLTPADLIGTIADKSIYVIIGRLDRPFDLGARRAIDEDIISREIAAYAHEEAPLSLSRVDQGGFRDDRYFSHEFTYMRDASNRMIPYKVCKKSREKSLSQDTCEFHYKDLSRGIVLQVGFSPKAGFDYQQMQGVAMQAAAKIISTSEANEQK